MGNVGYNQVVVWLSPSTFNQYVDLPTLLSNANVLALDLTNPLPPSIGALSRWTAEPVKNVWLPATAFIPNAKGYPVLSKACQAFLRAMTKVHPLFSLNTYPD
jgi:hypothetical protein